MHHALYGDALFGVCVCVCGQTLLKKSSAAYMLLLPTSSLSFYTDFSLHSQSQNNARIYTAEVQLITTGSRVELH